MKKIIKLCLTVMSFSVLVNLSLYVSGAEYHSLQSSLKKMSKPGSKLAKSTKTLTVAQAGEINKSCKSSYKEGDKIVIYKIKSAEGKVLSYNVVLEDLYNDSCFHKFIVNVNADMTVGKVLVMELSCPYSYPLNDEKYLKQYKGNSLDEDHKLKNSVDSISKSTESSKIAKKLVTKALFIVDLFY